MTFRIGQKVVCVDASPTSIMGTQRELVKDRIYTIRWCGLHHGNECVRLYEIAKRSLAKKDPEGDWPFRASRFRPLVEGNHDIGFAHEILRNASKPVKIPATVSGG